ncbi:MBL fold metallo-hydrolase [Clostridium sp. YIM B02515]|uniref:MBL fold metallo-hydrolase n=1 Tax=Clostridium rhizosphaerae TaxID=2803861 RepID=A0ABS1T7X6_9CLOT|nr:MBL fold metallo-hydrolase [Clostridium rhizosphaerae]MBL4935448.1 MBL fold metallo-hydrolase [Clostridium rhizosphaerae]
MREVKVKINYLYNSAFKLETENHVLIFDYFLQTSDTKNKNASDGIIGREDLTGNKPIYVFASHSHPDHYNESILKWKEVNPNIKYILSSDINIKNKTADMYTISVDESISLDKVDIKAFGSTDLGVSFLIKLDDITLFHAGDLNWWHWYDESDEDNRKQEENFKKEIEKLRNENIHIAFFPVDSRLKESYALGADYFIYNLKPQVFIPMHFREDYNITKEFSEKYKEKHTNILKISKKGQEFNQLIQL